MEVTGHDRGAVGLASAGGAIYVDTLSVACVISGGGTGTRVRVVKGLVVTVERNEVSGRDGHSGDSSFTTPESVDEVSVKPVDGMDEETTLKVGVVKDSGEVTTGFVLCVG